MTRLILGSWRGWRGVPAALLALLSSLVCSCSREAARPAVVPGGPNPFVSAPDLTTLPGTVFDVKFSPDTVRIEPQNFIQSLRGYTPDHTIFVFDRSSEAARSLQPGKILFVPGLTLAKVIAVAEDGADFVVGVDDHTPLTEAIESGTIKWDAPVNFQQAAAQQRGSLTGLPGTPGQGAQGLVPTVWAAEEPEKAECMGGGGWKHDIQGQPDAGGLNFKVHLEKESDDAGVSAEIDITGRIENFQNATSIVIKDHKVDSFGFHNKSMNATANVVWTVSKEKPGVATNEEHLRLPTSFSLPLMIGGIPFSLEISEAVLFKPGFTSKGELAKGGFKIQLNGDNGFTWSGPEVGGDEESKGEGSIEEGSGISPVAPFAILIAVAAPRIELSTGPDAAFEQLKRFVPPLSPSAEVVRRATEIFGKRFSDWATGVANRASECLKPKGAAYAQIILSTSATIGSATALIPCQVRKLVITGTAGVSIRLPYLPKDWKSEHTFFREEKNLVNPPVKACVV